MADASGYLGLGKCAALGIGYVLRPPFYEFLLILDLGINGDFRGRRPPRAKQSALAGRRKGHGQLPFQTSARWMTVAVIALACGADNGRHCVG